MRKAFGVITVLALAFVLAGCSLGGARLGAPLSITEVLGDDMLAIYESRDTKLPTAVIYTFQGNGVRVESPLLGEDAVNAVLDAISEIKIVGETEMVVADSDSSYIFINADGSEAGGISFNGGFLECGDKRYEVEGDDALASVDFPAESSRDMLTLDGPDPKMYEFLESCETETPVCVKVERDGSRWEITDAEAIEEAVGAFYSIGLDMYALRGTEQPSTVLSVTFLMRDGREYSLTLYDECEYIYEYPEPLGAWSFYINGAEYFIEALEGAAS